MDYLSPPPQDFLKSKGRVTTLGMFIIDHHAIKDDNENEIMTEDESIGGGGVFAMISARMFLPPTSCGLLIDKGEDFPSKFLEELGGFDGGDMIWYRDRKGKTTRALNIYSGGEVGKGYQSFKYLSPQLNLLPKDLILPPSPFVDPSSGFLPEYIHVVCNTQRAKLIFDELQEIRMNGLIDGIGKGWKPRLIWEPMPSSCTPSEIENIINLLPSFMIFSPNLLELQSILSIAPSSNPSMADAEKAVTKLYQLLKERYQDDQIPIIVIRCGELGSYTFSPTPSGWTGWVPAHYTSQDQHKVIDPTGGGNSFLGGLIAGLLISNGDIRIASIYAATAASFIIEQRGLPILTQTEDGERWNGVDVWKRLRELSSRVDELEQNKI